MLDCLLNIVPGTGDKAGNYYFNNFGEPFVYALIGFVIVFLGIIIIIAVIWLLGLLMRKTDNFAFLTHRKNRKTEQEKENITPAETTEGDNDVPDEVKASIIAAIMAYYETSKPQCEFKVKRIKRL